MAQGAIVKRQKRTLLNFQENFLIPFVTKAAIRYMQFAPDLYKVADYNFVAFSSLGAMAREYEVAQLSQILQVIQPDSPAHGAIIKGILDHLNVSNREELIGAIEQANQPNPEAQKQAAEQAELQKGILQGQAQLLNAQSQESSSRANKYNTEAQLMPQEVTLKYSDQNNDGEVDKDFEKKIRMAELLLKEQELQGKQDKQMLDSQVKAEAELANTLQSAPQQPPQGM